MNESTARASCAAGRDDPLLPRFATIRSIEEETSDVHTLVLEMGDDWSFAPGQFNMLYEPGCGEAAISISSAPGEPGLAAHTIRRAGNVTSSLLAKRPGDVVGVRGPFGSSWPWSRHRGADIVIAAGGIGLAPLRPLILDLLAHRNDIGSVHVLYGARTPAGLLYRRQYDAWRAGGIAVDLTVDHPDDDWDDHVGVVPALLESVELVPERTVLFTCGPEIMMRFTARAAKSHGIPDDRIYLSMERNMNCAVGFCGHCQLGGEFVCRDGPVFTYERIGRYLFVEEF